MQPLIFTDLDGTLLDDSYSFAAASPALQVIQERRIPLILCSSKTRTEIEYYRAKLNNVHPFISENGGAIFIPKEYFDFPVPNAIIGNQYLVVELGAPYPKLRSALKTAEQETGCTLTGFGDMSVDEVARATGLSRKEAALAKQRDYDEPFMVISGCESDALACIHRNGHQTTRARFLHVLSGNDKGKAVSILKNLYQQKYSQVYTIALGDSYADLAMLNQVDLPIIVQKPEGGYDSGLAVDTLRKAPGIGPLGWNTALLEFLSG